MDPEDTKAYASSILDKYQNYLDEVEGTCLADFTSNYIGKKADESVDESDIKSCTILVSGFEEESRSSNIVALKNEMGKMRKRRCSCVKQF